MDKRMDGPAVENIYCQYCGGSEGHGEYVDTKDSDSLNGVEYWHCCHRCRDAGLPCETFLSIKDLKHDTK